MATNQVLAVDLGQSGTRFKHGDLLFTCDRGKVAGENPLPALKAVFELSQKFEADGLRAVYPGLPSHPGHTLYNSMMNPKYGYGGMLTIDAGGLEKANKLMELMQERNVGYLAVSLGFYKTLFSAPGSSTSSEIPENEQKEMGLSDGLIRFSIGLDADIERTLMTMTECMKEVGII